MRVARSLFGSPVAERLAAVFTAQGLKDHPVEPELTRIAKLLDTDRHSLVTGRGLWPVGAEQAVPPRQIESEVAVGFTHKDRVVDAMHVRRHDEPAQHAVDSGGYTDVG